MLSSFCTTGWLLKAEGQFAQLVMIDHLLSLAMECKKEPRFEFGMNYWTEVPDHPHLHPMVIQKSSVERALYLMESCMASKTLLFNIKEAEAEFGADRDVADLYEKRHAQLLQEKEKKQVTVYKNGRTKILRQDLDRAVNLSFCARSYHQHAMYFDPLDCFITSEQLMCFFCRRPS